MSFLVYWFLVFKKRIRVVVGERRILTLVLITMVNLLKIKYDLLLIRIKLNTLFNAHV